MKNGIVVLNKGKSMTSQSAVKRVQRLFGAEKAGHTGTLDPDATGVLPILLNRGVKASAYMLESNKHYKAVLKLGVLTDTQDLSGKILQQTEDIPDKECVLKVAKSFIGEIEQTPPMYSALKVNGQKLVDLARKGVEIERESRKITIYQMECSQLTHDEYSLDVICSKGTYIRTLCEDIGKKLGCGGAMAQLMRVSSAGFDLSMAHTLEEYEQMTELEREQSIVPIETLFEQYPIYEPSAFYERLLRCGQAVKTSKLGINADMGQKYRVYSNKMFIALAEVLELEGAPHLKTEILFEL